MVLRPYLFNRFFRYVFLISVGLALLFTFIEFFEKLTHASHADLQSIFLFLGYNFVPTYFEHLPTSSWLATLFLIRELTTYHEWDTLCMLGISKRTLLGYFAIVGIILSCFSFVGKEIVSSPFFDRAQHIRTTIFKQLPSHTFFNRWFVLDDNRFCYLGFVDLATQSGHNFMLFDLDKNFSVKKILSAPTFTLTSSKNKLNSHGLWSLNTATAVRTEVSNTTLHLPALFTQMTLQSGATSLKKLATTLVLHGQTLTTPIKHRLTTELLSSLFWHLQLIAYPLITFTLFSLGLSSFLLTWLLLLAVYPLTALSLTVTGYLLRTGGPVWLSSLPYLLLFGLTALLTTLI